jgi:DNA repair exonuclease SbcCD ATPase subunit
MAEKTAVFSLKVDTGKSVQDIQAFDKAVEDLNKDLKDTSKTATDASTKGMETFDQKLAELNQRLEDGGLSMREMTKLMKEYQNLAARAGAETPVGKQAISNAAGLKDEIGDLKAQTMALSSDFVGLDTTLQGVETGAAAFQGIQSAAALAGVENEALVQTMVKLQAVQGLVNSVSIIANNLNKESILGLQLRNGLEKAKNFIMTGSIAPALAGVAATQAQTGANVGLATATGGATTAMKLFRLALIGTGIGAIVVGIGLLIANFDKVSAAVTNAYRKFEQLGPAVKILIGVMFPLIGIIYGVVKALEFFGVIDDAQTAKMKANAKAKTDATEKEMNKKISAEKKKAQAVDDNLSFEIRKAQAAGKNTEEMEEKKLKAALKSGREIFKLQKQKIQAYQEELDMLRWLGEADSDRAKKLEKSIKKTKTASYEQYKENKKNAQDLTIIQIEEDKKRDDANKAAYEKRKERIKKQKEDELNRLKAIAEAEKAANDKRIKEEDDRFALSMELMQAGFEKELQELVIQSDKRMEQAHGDKELEAQVEMQFLIDQADLRKKYSDIELAKLAETEAKKREIREKYTRLFNSDKDNELMDLRATYESEKDIALNALKAGLIDEETYLDRENQLTEKYKKKKAEIDKKYSDMEKENAIKAREEQLKGVTQAIEGAQQALNQLKDLNALMNEIDQARLNKIAENRDADLANLDAKLQAELNQEGLTADQKKQIEEKFAKQKYDVQLKAYEEEEKIKKAQFNRDKALKLAQIAIDTASAIVKGIAQFGPPPSPAGIAAIASAGLIGLTQALAVMNQKYQSGTAPTPPQLSTGGGGGQAGAGASSFTANTNAQQTDLTTLGQGQGGNVPVSQVVVLESDITGTQNKVEVQEAKSTF